MKRFLSMAAVLLFAMGVLIVSRAVLQTSAPAAPISPSEQDQFFRASPDVIERGDQVTLSWRVPGVETVSIQQRYGSYKNPEQAFYKDLPAEGSLVVDLTTRSNEFEMDIPYIYGVDFNLFIPSDTSAAYVPTGYAYNTSTSVTIRCPYEGFFFGVDPRNEDFCPLDEPQSVETVYQPFEDGFLVWRSDTDTIYAYYNTIYATGSAVDFKSPSTAPTNTAVTTTPQNPSDVQPAAVFARAMSHALVQSFGASTAPETRYQATIQDSYGVSLTSDVVYLTLPDERVVGYVEDLYLAHWHCVSCVEATQTP